MVMVSLETMISVSRLVGRLKIVVLFSVLVWKSSVFVLILVSSLRSWSWSWSYTCSWSHLTLGVIFVLKFRRRKLVHIMVMCYTYYLADDIYLVSEGPRGWLHSSTNRSCAIPHTHNTFGDKSFAAAGQRVWNSLPAHVRDEDITYNSFRRELKTYWFYCCFRGAMRHPA